MAAAPAMGGAALPLGVEVAPALCGGPAPLARGAGGTFGPVAQSRKFEAPPPALLPAPTASAPRQLLAGRRSGTLAFAVATVAGTLATEGARRRRAVRRRAARRTARNTTAGREGGALPVLLEDDSLLVVDKPAGLLSQAFKRGEESLCSHVRAHLAMGGEGGGDSSAASRITPFVGLVHRLDRDVTGACTFAKTPAAARWLGAQFSDRKVLKEYIGVVRRWRGGPGVRELRHMVWTDDAGVARVVVGGGGKEAALECRPLCSGPSGVTAVLVKLLTGRRHQIRAQLAEVESPLLGDPRYGHGTRDGSRRWIRRPALHAWRLRFAHPAAPHVPCEVAAPLPGDIAALLSAVQLRPEEVVGRAVEQCCA